MPVTPARQARDVERNEQKRAEGRMQNEAKYTEFRVNCDEGDAGACTSLGEWWAMMRKDFKQALELYSPMCLERKYPQACLNLGNLLVAGKEGIPLDVPAAAKAYEIGCRGGNADACFEGGMMRLRDASLKLRMDSPAPRAEGSASKAGPVSEAAAVVPAATPVASAGSPVAAVPGAAPALLLGTDSPAQSLRLGLELLHLGCEADITVANGRCCGQLGYSYFSALAPISQVWDAPREGAKADQTTRAAPAAAAGAVPLKCRELSPAEVVEAARGLPAFPGPVALLERGCDMENPAFCSHLARLYRNGHAGVGVAPDRERAHALDRKALMWEGYSEKVADMKLARRAQQQAQAARAAASAGAPLS